MNQLEYDDANIGFISVEQFVQKIADLPKDKELAARIYMEIFGFDETYIAQKIRKVSVFFTNLFQINISSFLISI